VRRVAVRALAAGSLVLAIVLAAVVMFDDSGGYTLRARFQNAGQVVTGGLVEVAGKRVGNVTGHRLTDDGLAELELSIDEDWAPLPRGTHAQIRQFGLSGPASRYIELRLPDGNTRGHLPDGGVLGIDQTTSNVDLDEVFAMFEPRTRKALRGVVRGSERQYRGQGAEASKGWVYLDPALVSASRLFQELNRDTPELRRFFVETSQLAGDVAERRDDLAGLVDNLADTTGAIARPKGALGEAIHRLPPFMRQANATYVNLRSALDDLDPLVEEAKPVARELRPYTAELRRLVTDLEPTVADLSRTIRRPGRSNDLLELLRAQPKLRDIAVGPVKRNGKEREGALPASAEALEGATPRFAFARPYSVDFTGWLDDFSHSGNFDALGGFARIGTHVNAFSIKEDVIAPIAPGLRPQALKALGTIGQNNRCPGAAERDPGDGSTPFRPTEDFNCDPRQLPPGK
jgi:phospholipid/cholesterol/gamma-HCH transport system substrate-binding protein